MHLAVICSNNKNESRERRERMEAGRGWCLVQCVQVAAMLGALLGTARSSISPSQPPLDGPWASLLVFIFKAYRGYLLLGFCSLRGAKFEETLGKHPDADYMEESHGH